MDEPALAPSLDLGVVLTNLTPGLARSRELNDLPLDKKIGFSLMTLKPRNAGHLG